ncbi:MAG: LPS export ABC transporter permease LptF, partial [Gammaproteobacteria bacterium]|nr:LPS export ABC transporter permease LptF [Gammaproteobacteria bacterium]
MVYITYANMLAIARVWVEREQVPTWVGIWWVHGVLGLIGLVLLAREVGVFVRARPVETT